MAKSARPANKAPSKNFEALSDQRPMGRSGLARFGGTIHEDILGELRGLRGARAFRKMADQSPVVGAILFAITTLLRQAPWTVQAADDSTDAEDAKVFVEECINDMERPFSAMVDEACSMFVYGYAPMEKTFKRRNGYHDDPALSSKYTDGAIGISSIDLRAQTSITDWIYDETTDRLRAVRQQTVTAPPVDIPVEKLLLFRTTQALNNPEGKSILRTAYRHSLYVERIENIEAVGIERDLAGLPVVYVPGSLFKTDKDTAEAKELASWRQLVTQLRRDEKEGVVMPSERDNSGNLLYELKLLATAGSRTFDTTKIIDRYSRMIATSVLADFIFLGQQSVGSFALSSDKTALFAASIGAFGQSIADTFNAGVIDPLWRLNAFDDAVKPKLKMGDLEHVDLDKLGKYVTALAGAGAPLFPDRELENFLRSQAGMPEAPEDGPQMPMNVGPYGDAAPGASDSSSGSDGSGAA